MHFLRSNKTRTLLASLVAPAAILLAPAAAQAGTALATTPNLPDGARAGGIVTVGETGVSGSVEFTQTFNAADTGATARLRQFRLTPTCGPGPSAGNPSANGPAVNTPEIPCTNPDLDVFSDLPLLASGAQACAGNSFTVLPPDSNGTIEMLPLLPVLLMDGQTCEVRLTFSVQKLLTFDTFPTAPGMQTTSVSSVRSEIILDPGNASSIGLQAAGIGSGSAVVVRAPDDPTCIVSPTNPCSSSSCATASACSTCADGSSGAACAASVTAASKSRLNLKSKCARSRVRASVSGTEIDRVTYVLDGHVVRKVGKAPYRLSVPMPRTKRSSHRLTATVSFQPATLRKPQVFSKRLASCARARPNFTG